MSNWSLSIIIQLQKTYAQQVRIKRWRDRCRSGEFNHGEVMKLVEKLGGASWYQSRKSGHRIFGFRSMSKKLEFAKTLGLTDDGFVSTNQGV